MKNKMCLFLLSILTMISCLNAEISSNEVIIIDQATLHWENGSYPGVQMAQLFGDSEDSTQPYTIRVRFPANFTGRIHKHNQTEFHTVISGSLYVGIGEIIDKEHSIYVPAGGAFAIPANVSHYLWTSEDVEMQLHSLGEKETEYVK